MSVLHTIAQQKHTLTSQSSYHAKPPEWWWPPLHDWALLRAVFKHGFGNVDEALNDPLFTPAWKPEPSPDHPVLTTLLLQSSGAKSALWKDIEKYVTSFLQDRNPSHQATDPAGQLAALRAVYLSACSG